MTPRRSIIPILGVILYLGIVIGAATDGKPGMLLATLVALVLIFFLRILRSKMHDNRKVALPTEEETLLNSFQQQSHIQLMAIFIPVILVAGAIYGDLSVLMVIVMILLIIFACFSLKKRSDEQEAIYSKEKVILFKSFVFGLVLALLTMYFYLAK